MKSLIALLLTGVLITACNSEKKETASSSEKESQKIGTEQTIGNNSIESGSTAEQMITGSFDVGNLDPVVLDEKIYSLEAIA